MGRKLKMRKNWMSVLSSLVMKCAYGSAVWHWSPKACFNENSGIKHHLQRSRPRVWTVIFSLKWLWGGGWGGPGQVSKMTSEVSPVRMRATIQKTQLLHHPFPFGRMVGLTLVWVGLTLVWVLKKKPAMLPAWKKTTMYVKRAEANVAYVSMCVHEVSC